MSIRVRLLTETDRADWDRLVLQSPGSGFMQSWNWADFKALEGYHVLRVGLFDRQVLTGGAMVYAYPLLDEATQLSIPDGPVLPWTSPQATSLFQTLMAWIKESDIGQNAVTVRLEPRLTEKPIFLQALHRAPIDLVPNETLLVSLGSEADMLTPMKPKGRYNIRLAERHGVQVETSTDFGLIHTFYDTLKHTAGFQQFSLEPKSFFINLMQSHVPERARFAFARYRGIVLACALTLRHGDQVTYLYGGHVPLFRSVMASYALHWHLLKEAARDGFRTYDFYGYTTPDQTAHAYYGFSRFKEKFGGEVVKRMGSHDYLFVDRLARTAFRWLRTVPEATAC